MIPHGNSFTFGIYEPISSQYDPILHVNLFYFNNLFYLQIYKFVCKYHHSVIYLSSIS